MLADLRCRRRSGFRPRGMCRLQVARERGDAAQQLVAILGEPIILLDRDFERVRNCSISSSNIPLPTVEFA